MKKSKRESKRGRPRLGAEAPSPRIPYTVRLSPGAVDVLRQRREDVYWVLEALADRLRED